MCTLSVPDSGLPHTIIIRQGCAAYNRMTITHRLQIKDTVFL